MKKRFKLLLFFVLFTTNIFSQISSQYFTVFDNKVNPLNNYYKFNYVETADLDKDGKIDVVATCVGRMVWFRNLGNLKFSDPILLFSSSTDLHESYVDIGDIDNDGDLDITTVSDEDDVGIYWFENLGNASQFKEHLIERILYSNCSVLNDIDDDGDLDILIAGTRDVDWYKNTDGRGNFKFEKKFLYHFNGGYHYVKADDFDSDGDQDVIYWRYNNSNFNRDTTYLNLNIDGKGKFSNRIVLGGNDPKEVYDVELIDLDGDNEKDIIYSCACDPSGSGGQIFWRAIKNGIVQKTNNVIDSKLRVAKYINKEDIDGDGDLDLYSGVGSKDDVAKGDILIFINQGQGRFTNFREQLSFEGWIRSTKAVDLDGDGKFEIIAANTQGVFGITLDFSAVSTKEKIFDSAILYSPNPVVDELKIEPINISTENIIEIYSLLGKLVLRTENLLNISLNNLESGTYILHYKEKFNDRLEVKKIVKI